MRQERSITPASTTQQGPAVSAAPGTDLTPLALSGVVGDSILGNADVARTRERHRHSRVRRVVAVGALMFGWVAIRTFGGRSIFPSVSLPHWAGPVLPLAIIVLLLGGV